MDGLQRRITIRRSASRRSDRRIGWHRRDPPGRTASSRCAPWTFAGKSWPCQGDGHPSYTGAYGQVHGLDGRLKTGSMPQANVMPPKPPHSRPYGKIRRRHRRRGRRQSVLPRRRGRQLGLRCCCSTMRPRWPKIPHLRAGTLQLFQPRAQPAPAFNTTIVGAGPQFCRSALSLLPAEPLRPGCCSAGVSYEGHRGQLFCRSAED